MNMTKVDKPVHAYSNLHYNVHALLAWRCNSRETAGTEYVSEQTTVAHF